MGSSKTIEEAITRGLAAKGIENEATMLEVRNFVKEMLAQKFQYAATSAPTPEAEKTVLDLFHQIFPKGSNK